MRDSPGYTLYRDVFGGWRWEYYDRAGEAIDSRESFDISSECIDDARRHEYERSASSAQENREPGHAALDVSYGKRDARLTSHAARELAGA